MEELLNKLIEKGWKPFGWKDIKRINNEGWFVCFVHKSKERPWLSNVSYRELVSKESGLRQFVCENKMVRLDTDSGETDSYRCYYNDDGYPKDNSFEVERDDYRFRLLESSLIDESELESFILDNIKV